MLYFFRLALFLEDSLEEVFFWTFDPASFFLPGREKLSFPAYQRERFHQQQQKQSLLCSSNCLLATRQVWGAWSITDSPRASTGGLRLESPHTHTQVWIRAGEIKRNRPETSAVVMAIRQASTNSTSEGRTRQGSVSILSGGILRETESFFSSF